VNEYNGVATCRRNERVRGENRATSEGEEKEKGRVNQRKKGFVDTISPTCLNLERGGKRKDRGDNLLRKVLREF